MIKLVERRKGFRRWELGEGFKIYVCCYRHPCNERPIWYIEGVDISGDELEVRYFVKALFELAKEKK